MKIKIGKVKEDSDLYKYLKKRSLNKTMGIGSKPALYVEKLNGSHNVYRISDRKSHKKFIIKSFYEEGKSRSNMVHYLNKEYDRIKYFRDLGVGNDRYKTVKVINKNDENLFLIEEYAPGASLSTFIKKAYIEDKPEILYEKLTLLAGYLSSLHKKTGKKRRINRTAVKKEIIKHSYQAYCEKALDGEELPHIEHLLDKWLSYDPVRKAHISLVHGDATPSNFLFSENGMLAIDLERSRYRDPVQDLGTMAGELFHYATMYTKNPYNADKFIGHMYWYYAGNFDDQSGMFIDLTKRNPLYMANSMFRISRNPYISLKYKRKLGHYAMKCLSSIDRMGK
ncbi:aminoglycoside phosphotransferase family protein [Methanooceanicella nereidis]|nr:aminoglycoside phosphotransferase family protein [Methanocella sp. CWC-04]